MVILCAHHRQGIDIDNFSMIQTLDLKIRSRLLYHCATAAVHLPSDMVYRNFILHERSEWSKWSEVKGTKRALKNCLSVCGWEGMCLSVCVSVLQKKLNNGTDGTWQNFQDQSNSVQVIFGRGSQISWPPGYNPGTKITCFNKIYLLPEF